MTGAGRGPCASHPLAQTILPSPGSSDWESALPTSGRQESVHQWAPVPVNLSLYDGTGVGNHASFISTASSHDLTMHHRVNTTFDPAMGFGAGAPGLLDDLVRRIIRMGWIGGCRRKNEALMDRLRRLEEEKKAGLMVVALASAGGRGRRASAGAALGDVEEDVGGQAGQALL
ncbi:hypothetical protein L208DRAFT_1245847 [Tricholoma matsutake]|nr:hypothetical protein L208DRAFT_1245847 [Tricholoma matsutake 945]